MHLKVVINIFNATRFHLCLILILSFFSIVLLFGLSNESLKDIFLYSTLIHVLISICCIYSFFEISLLHRKQGSKLNLSKEKLFFRS